MSPKTRLNGHHQNHVHERDKGNHLLHWRLWLDANTNLGEGREGRGKGRERQGEGRGEERGEKGRGKRRGGERKEERRGEERGEGPEGIQEKREGKGRGRTLGDKVSRTDHIDWL